MYFLGIVNLCADVKKPQTSEGARLKTIETTTRELFVLGGQRSRIENRIRIVRCWPWATVACRYDVL